MKQKKFNWEIWLEDSNKMENSFNFYITKEMLKLAKCKPEEAIMIGDSLEDDILSSRKLGINAIHFKKDYNKIS